jgi:hypothetical protein
VTDTGPGPTDPLVGLLPPDPRTDPGPGLGLWLINQLVDLTHRHHPDGYCQVPGLVEAGLSPADALPDGVVGVVERLVLSGWDEAEFAV